MELEPASPHHYALAMAWLRTEFRRTGQGFYCNRDIIRKAFAAGRGICAVKDGVLLGFAVYTRYSNEGGSLDIISVRPKARNQGVGTQLLEATVATLQRLGARFVDAECATEAGESLCRRHGFQNDEAHERRGSGWSNPMLRRHLTDWRPAPRKPRA